MSKLHPPQIGGTLPAFYECSKPKENYTDEYVEIRIPYIMNKAVASKEVTGFNLLIKNASKGNTIGTLSSTDRPADWDNEKGEVVFTIPKVQTENENSLYLKLQPGLHYKMQLAYTGLDGVIGHYSSIGVAKYIVAPEVLIPELDIQGQNMGQQTYIGTYSQLNGDYTEKVYSYRFDIYDAYGNLYITSGDQLHNSAEDETTYSSSDSFTLYKDLKDNENYKIRYTVNTINNATFSSPVYQIVQKTTVNPDLKATLSAKLNYDNGYTDIRLVGEKDADGIEYPASGRFVLKRGCNKDNYGEWNTILDFELNGQKPSRWLWRDFTIEHGYSYKYALQQFNDEKMYSNKIYSNEIDAAFEDIFLYDGERQLKVKYNPKITSFKNTLLETKTNTIGNKYPYTFRNGKVYYKEFPINGLISYFSDEEELFISKEEIYLKDETTNLIDSNVASERMFKLKVLEFFNNGKPKLFRSPAEGNYIIKIINVSMTPLDQLSRMLHNITGTAYEIADCTYKNLKDMGFIVINNVSDNKVIRWATVPLLNNDFATTGQNVLEHAPIHHIKLDDLPPGTVFTIGYEGDNSVDIVIGPTGSYEAYSEEGIYSLSFKSTIVSESILTYQYEDTESNTFDKIVGVDLLTYPAIQWFGENENILNDFNNIETELLEILYMKFYKREVHTVYKNNNQYAWDQAGDNIINHNEENIYHVYKVMKAKNNTTNDMIEYEGPIGYYGWNGSAWTEILNYSNTIEILYKDDKNPVLIDITDTEYYNLEALENIESIKIPVGVRAEGGVYAKKYIYNIANNTNNNIDGDINKYPEKIQWLRAEWAEALNYAAERRAAGEFATDELYQAEVQRINREYQALIEAYSEQNNTDDINREFTELTRYNDMLKEYIALLYYDGLKDGYMKDSYGYLEEDIQNNTIDYIYHHSYFDALEEKKALLSHYKEAYLSALNQALLKQKEEEGNNE